MDPEKRLSQGSVFPKNSSQDPVQQSQHSRLHLPPILAAPDASYQGAIVEGVSKAKLERAESITGGPTKLKPGGASGVAAALSDAVIGLDNVTSSFDAEKFLQLKKVKKMEKLTDEDDGYSTAEDNKEILKQRTSIVEMANEGKEEEEESDDESTTKSSTSNTTTEISSSSDTTTTSESSTSSDDDDDDKE